MNRRHRWSKDIKGVIRVTEPFEHGLSLMMKLKNVKECEYCGLRKGIIMQRYYSSPTTIYFDKDDKILSRNTLPYKCVGVQKDFYLSKEDFYV